MPKSISRRLKVRTITLCGHFHQKYSWFHQRPKTQTTLAHTNWKGFPIIFAKWAVENDFNFKISYYQIIWIHSKKIIVWNAIVLSSNTLRSFLWETGRDKKFGTRDDFYPAFWGCLYEAGWVEKKDGTVFVPSSWKK